MAYTSGSLILDDDYNIFATGSASGAANHGVANINTILGAGTGDKGYGQSNTISAVSAGSTITATQWSTLLTRMNQVASHQGTSLTAITNPSVGDTVTAYAALSSNITAITNNRNNAAASGADITTNGTTTTTSTWDVSAVATSKTFTFASADAMRYFFNAGGMLRISLSRSGGTVSNKNAEWTDLLSQCGTIVLTGSGESKTIAGTALGGTAKVGGGGTPNTLTTTTGVFDLTASPITIFEQFADTVPYTSNYVTMTASATTTSVTVNVSLFDVAADTIAPDGSGSGDNLDIVDGTLTMTAVIRPPSTANLTSTWGTPTMNATTWTLTS